MSERPFNRVETNKSWPMVKSNNLLPTRQRWSRARRQMMKLIIQDWPPVRFASLKRWKVNTQRIVRKGEGVIQATKVQGNKRSEIGSFPGLTVATKTLIKLINQQEILSSSYRRRRRRHHHHHPLLQTSFIQLAKSFFANLYKKGSETRNDDRKGKTDG